MMRYIIDFPFPAIEHITVKLLLFSDVTVVGIVLFAVRNFRPTIRMSSYWLVFYPVTSTCRVPG